MRVSADKNDTGYDRWMNEAVRRGVSPYSCKIFLDGKEQPVQLVTADTEVGLIVRMMMDENDCPIIENNDFKREILYGKVEIYWPGDPLPHANIAAQPTDITKYIRF